jgi:hypothetical protein
MLRELVKWDYELRDACQIERKRYLVKAAERRRDLRYRRATNKWKSCSTSELYQPWARPQCTDQRIASRFREASQHSSLPVVPQHRNDDRDERARVEDRLRD